MDRQAELLRERAFAARVKQLLEAIIQRAKGFSDAHDSTINMLLSDAWEELRLKPTALSVTDLDTLGNEVIRFQLRQALAVVTIERSTRMLQEPFFARVDFQENGEDALDRIMIGLYSLKDDMGNLLVHDWRAPIAALYYDATLGDVCYEAPNGAIEGKMTLRRQYRIANGEIEYFVDTDVCIEDDVLLDILSGATSTRMRSIVSTIQREQNRAIRSDGTGVLSVVGGAGSGKTSVAMHRAAYLMYRQREHLSAKSIAVLSPTSAFSEYISGVLPDLGEENARALVLSGVYAQVIGLATEPPLKQLERLGQKSYSLRRDSVQYKSGADFVALLDEFTRSFRIHGPKFADLGKKGNYLIKKSELEHLYRSEYRMLTPKLRLTRIQAVIDSRLVTWEKSLRDKFEEKLSVNYRGKELNMAVHMAVNQHLAPLRSKTKQMLAVDPLLLYADALKDIPEPLSEAAAENAAARLVWFEDAPGIAYLMMRLGFAPPDRSIRHLMIDEAQDYPLIAMSFLHQYFPNADVTLLGDPNQRTGPGMPGINPLHWGACFDVPNAPIIELTRCYRSTAQITRLCNALLPEGAHIEPFGREGVKPSVGAHSEAALRDALERFKKQGHKHIAVIARALPEAEMLAASIEHAWLIADEDDMMPEAGGVVVSCYHLMKGLEFDAVAVVWPEIELDDGERRRLYTACSRALHDLALLGAPSLIAELGLVL